MGTLEKEMKSSTSSFVECISEKSQLDILWMQQCALRKNIITMARDSYKGS